MYNEDIKNALSNDNVIDMRNNVPVSFLAYDNVIIRLYV